MTGGDLRRHHRPRPQRLDAAVLRLDLRHDRPREHHVHRLRHRRRRHLGALYAWATIRSGSCILSAASCSLPGARSTSLFPSTCTDTFGAKFAHHQCRPASTRPRARAALLVPVANYMQQSSGNWDNVFVIAAGANILASLLAIAGAETLAQDDGGGLASLGLIPTDQVHRTKARSSFDGRFLLRALVYLSVSGAARLASRSTCFRSINSKTSTILPAFALAVRE